MTNTDGAKPAEPVRQAVDDSSTPASPPGVSILNMAEGRPRENDPVSPSVPRAGPGLRVDPQVEAVLAQAQAALLQGDAQKAAELFAEATRLGMTIAAEAPPSTPAGKPDAGPSQGS